MPRAGQRVAAPRTEPSSSVKRLMLPSPVGPLFVEYDDAAVRYIHFWPQGAHPPAGTRVEPTRDDPLGWKVAEQLAKANVTVLVGALNNIPRDFSTLGARQDNAALLHQAGVKVVIAGGADAFNARNVKYEAGVAVSFGMPWDAALRAVTLGPAELYGVADRVGTLQPGRDATLVVWSGDPFEPATRAERVLVNGAEVQRPSRQDELMRRYQRFPPAYRGKP